MSKPDKQTKQTMQIKGETLVRRWTNLRDAASSAGAEESPTPTW